MTFQCTIINMFQLDIKKMFVSHVVDVSKPKDMFLHMMIFTLETEEKENLSLQFNNGKISWTYMIRNTTEKTPSILLCWVKEKKKREEFGLLMNCQDNNTDQEDNSTLELLNKTLKDTNMSMLIIWEIGEVIQMMSTILTTDGFLKTFIKTTEMLFSWIRWPVIAISTD